MKPVLSGIDDILFEVNLNRFPLRHKSMLYRNSYRKGGYVVRKTKLHPEVDIFRVYNIYPKGMYKGVWNTYDKDFAPLTLYYSRVLDRAYIRIRKLTERYVTQEELLAAINRVVKCPSLDLLIMVRCDFFVDFLTPENRPDLLPLVNRHFVRTHTGTRHRNWKRYGKLKGKGPVRIYDKQEETLKKRREYYVDPDLMNPEDMVCRIEVVCRHKRLKAILGQTRSVRFSDLKKIINNTAAKSPFYMVFHVAFREDKLRSNARYKKAFYYYKKLSKIEGMEPAYDYASARRVAKTWFIRTPLAEPLRKILSVGLCDLFGYDGSRYFPVIWKSIQKYARSGQGISLYDRPLTRYRHLEETEPPQSFLDYRMRSRPSRGPPIPISAWRHRWKKKVA